MEGMAMEAWGAIFDWDGVIVDSSAHHRSSWKRLAEEEGRKLPDNYFAVSFGMKNEDILPKVLKWTRDPKEIARLSERKENLYRELVRREGIEPLPGVAAWLKLLRQSLIPCAIGSSTERLNIDCVLEQTELGQYFDEIVSADDVSRGKPDPQVFLLASEWIEVPPHRCVVFEDAPVGLEAARAGGMKSIGIATTHPAESLREADLKVNRLDELSLEAIRNLLGNSASKE